MPSPPSGRAGGDPECLASSASKAEHQHGRGSCGDWLRRCGRPLSRRTPRAQRRGTSWRSWPWAWPLFKSRSRKPPRLGSAEAIGSRPINSGRNGPGALVFSLRWRPRCTRATSSGPAHPPWRSRRSWLISELTPDEGGGKPGGVPGRHGDRPARYAAEDPFLRSRWDSRTRGATGLGADITPPFGFAPHVLPGFAAVDGRFPRPCVQRPAGE